MRSHTPSGLADCCEKVKIRDPSGRLISSGLLGSAIPVLTSFILTLPRKGSGLGPRQPNMEPIRPVDRILGGPRRENVAKNVTGDESGRQQSQSIHVLKAIWRTRMRVLCLSKESKIRRGLPLAVALNCALLMGPSVVAQETPNAPQPQPASRVQQSRGETFGGLNYLDGYSFLKGPISPYKAKHVAAPNLSNSPRMDQLMRDGKI